MDGHRLISRAVVVYENGSTAYIGPPFKIVGNGDLDGDTKADILWYNTQTGESQVWFMNGHRLISRAVVVYENSSTAYIGPPFTIVANSDLSGDNKADILWYNTQTGESQAWFMAGHRLIPGRWSSSENGSSAAYIAPPFSIVGVGRFNPPSSPTGVDDYPYRSNPICDLAAGQCATTRGA